jgi:hypothetical protein
MSSRLRDIPQVKGMGIRLSRSGREKKKKKKKKKTSKKRESSILPQAQRSYPVIEDHDLKQQDPTKENIQSTTVVLALPCAQFPASLSVAPSSLVLQCTVLGKHW